MASSSISLSSTANSLGLFQGHQEEDESMVRTFELLRSKEHPKEYGLYVGYPADNSDALHNGIRPQLAYAFLFNNVAAASVTGMEASHDGADGAAELVYRIKLDGNVIEPGGIVSHVKHVYVCTGVNMELLQLIIEAIEAGKTIPSDRTSHQWLLRGVYRRLNRRSSSSSCIDTRRSMIVSAASAVSDISAASEASQAEIQAYVNWRAQSHGDDDMQAWKRNWIHDQMDQLEEEFTKRVSFRVSIGTYNVNGRHPVREDGSADDLSTWIRSQAHTQAPDLIVVGFQELDLSKEAFVFADTKREEEWHTCIAAALPEDASYVKIASRQLVGMLIIAYLKTEWKHDVLGLDTDAIGCGLMGVLGNKGAVSISLTLRDTTMCFVASHLAAHDDAILRRNQDFHTIMQRLGFDRSTSRVRSIKDHDYLFWMGDLNYRINAPDAQVRQWAVNEDLGHLLDNDQLAEQMRRGAAFLHFEEAPITFRPTYKYDPGTSVFDTSEKQRSPAYTDRVLYYTFPGRNSKVIQLDCLEYVSAHEVCISDHKPVRAIFDITLAIVDETKQSAAHLKVIRKMDVLENSAMPATSLDKQQLDFGTVRYRHASTQSLTLTNTSQVPARFTFSAEHLPDETFPDWLSMEPAEGVVGPDSQLSIKMKVDVGVQDAHLLNNGQDALSVILVLRVDNGKDHFITVNGSMMPTFLCRRLEDMVYMTRPAREYALEPVPRDIAPMRLPKEIWLLGDCLLRQDALTAALFTKPAMPEEIEVVLDALDTEMVLPEDINIDAVAMALYTTLESLAEPVVPFAAYQRCLDCSHNARLAKQIIIELEPVSSTTFIYVMALLKQIISNTPRAKRQDTTHPLGMCMHAYVNIYRTTLDLCCLSSSLPCACNSGNVCSCTATITQPRHKSAT
eukprot:TRINITY_DN11798_c0_g2_i2.p1 TRINITY_DN11798_c0_g2~~TRINITY_DN11798_c0_g2_i2.p1  ORF type:complete len:902 (+),score=169.49 TRINITY_DN11798_c0_g2_i2:96-2801(+)